jgi:RNA polymerase sigma-70 factor (ECF subfamily)
LELGALAGTHVHVPRRALTMTTTDRNVLHQIHLRVVDGDVTAPSELFVAVQGPLAATVRQRLGGQISLEDAGDMATDAILEYLRQPDRFDPSRSGLFGYLLMIARGDALNHLRDMGKAASNFARLVELWLPDGNTTDEDSELRRLDAERILRDHRADLVRDDGDDEVLRLYLEGERATAEYSAALGVQHLTEAEQQDLVKTRKDRIEQRLKRLRGVVK